jgi:siroheme synthase-like protein
MLRAMRTLPIALVVERERCLIVGRGEPALERAVTLRERGADVTWVTRDAAGALPCSGIHVVAREVDEADLKGVRLVVLTDMDAPLAERLATLSRSAGAVYCAVDQPEHSSFLHMARAEAGTLTLAVSTDGAAPALGRRMREELARCLAEAGFDAFVARVAELRRSLPREGRGKVLAQKLKALRFDGRWILPELEG